MSQASNAPRRVVITGIGVMSPQGIGRDAFWQSLQTGRTGVLPTVGYTASATPGGLGGEVRGFDEESAKKVYLKEHRKHLKVMGREVMMGVAAALQAIQDARLDDSQMDRERMGVEFGANLMFSTPQQLSEPGLACTEGGQPPFQMNKWGSEGFSNLEPLWMLKYLPNMPACHVAIFTDARGPNNSITQDEVSSNLALGEAAAVIRRNHADVMITGSTGRRLHPVKEIHARQWESLGWDPQHPEQSVRPFDVRRNGNAVAEAGACLVLEHEATATARGATILGELLGTGSSCVATPDGQPDIRRAVTNALRKALRMAGLRPADVGHVNAHGAATPQLDALEAAGIRDVFGADAPQVPVVALKGYHGNPGAPGGMLELAMSMLSLQQGFIPHTLNTDRPDPELGLNIVCGQPLATHNRVVAKVSYTLIGQASAVVVRC